MNKSRAVLALAWVSGTALVSQAIGSPDDKGYWHLQTSVYTRHFSPSPEHTNRQNLIGIERNESSGWLYGAATFRNSFGQQSVYTYGGKQFEGEDHPFYVKLSAGLLYGYRGEYRDKIPLNRYGVAPALIPGVGIRVDPMTAELVLLGSSAAMVNVGLRF